MNIIYKHGPGGIVCLVFRKCPRVYVYQRESNKEKATYKENPKNLLYKVILVEFPQKHTDAFVGGKSVFSHSSHHCQLGTYPFPASVALLH